MKTAIQAALELLNAKPLDYDSAKAIALMTNYDAVWGRKYQEYSVMEVESEFRFPLMNPETEGQSKTFDEAGKIDLLLQHKVTGRFVIGEHKTTADDISPVSDYWARLTMDFQCSKYFLAKKIEGLDVGSILYDVIHKPGSRPRQIPILDEEGTKIVLDASGARVRTANGKKWRESADKEAGYVLQTVQETPAQYGARLLEEIETAPEKHFAQREVPRLESELLEYMNDAWAQAQQILYFRRANLWPRNPGACTAFGNCEFFDLCAGRASVDGIRYRQSKKHRELSMEEGGKELLTNSRLTALRKCARYHYHRYECPVEPCAEESEALRFGTLLHQAFEAYFNQMKNNQQNKNHVVS